MFEDILQGWRRGARGPLPQLTNLQVLVALILIRREGPVGRRVLSHALRINDGVARGLLERLSDHKIITITENGASLSENGEKRLGTELESLSVKSIHELDETDLVPGKHAAGVCLANKYKHGLTGLKERDEAVRAGADGTITLAMLHGRLVMPPDNRDTRETSSTEDDRLRKLFRPLERDLLIIGFADDSRTALVGALAAAIAVSSSSSK